MWGNRVIYLFVSLLFIDAVSSALHPHWRLAWSDEFNNGSIIDTTKWNVRTRIGNFYKGEQQYYHPDQVSVINGNLVLTAINQTFGGQKYKSGLVDSQDKGHFTYARFEFRAKMARGKGMWPAIWMLSETKCWTLGAEIDMAEYRGSYPNEIGMFYHSSNKCCTQLSGCSQSQSKKLNEGVNYSSDFHTYAVEWHPTNMTWIIDDNVKFSYQTSSLSYAQDTSPHYFVINSAVGGSYPGTPDSTTPFPNYLMIDYIRVYVLRQSCSGSNVCSNHGCCDSSFLCRCNTGWTGASCEFWIGTYVNDFNAITNMDMIPNGWGNDVTMYLTNRAAIVSNALRLSLSNQSCPGDCGSKGYGSGGWESQGRHGYGTFTYIAKSSNVPGTGYSLSAAGDNPNSLEQIAIVFPGVNKTFVSLQSWKTGYHFIHNNRALIPLGFDASAAYHNYTIVYAATSFKLYVDTVLKYTAIEVVPSGLLNMGAFYTAQPAWYGGTFKYTAVSYAYLDKATWEIAPGATASC